MATTSTPQKCEQCLTEGITLMPMRWGYRTEGTTMKSVSRLPHEGYIYVLDNNSRWYGYVVTEGRYLKQFNVKQDAPSLPAHDSSCFHKDGDCQVLASMIRIPNPLSDITTLWVAYSPVKWTQTVLDHHRKNKKGAKTQNMVEVPVSATEHQGNTPLVQSEAQNAGGYDIRLDGDGKEVYATEYTGRLNLYTQMPNQPDRSGIGTSKPSEAEQLSQTLESIENKNIDTTQQKNRVLNVYFKDSIGKLVDLNELMLNAEAFFAQELLSDMGEPSTERLTQKVQIAQIITNFKEQVVRQAKVAAPKYAQDLRKRAMHTLHGYSYYLLTPQHDIEEKYIKDQWEPMADMLREGDMQAWQNNYQSVLASITTEKTGILQAFISEYIGILTSQRLLEQMTHNFEQSNPESGADYAITVQKFIGSTARYQQLSQRYKQMLSVQSLEDEQNYIGRAYLFNDKTVIKNIMRKQKDTGMTSQQLLELAWGTASGVGGEFVSQAAERYQAKLREHGTNITLAEVTFESYLQTQQNTHNTSTFFSSYEGVMIGRSDLLMSLFTGKKLGVVEIDGTLRNYVQGIYRLLQTEMNALGRGSVSGNDMRHAVDNFLVQMADEGVNLDFTTPVKLKVFVDLEAANTAKINYQSSLEKLNNNYVQLRNSGYSRAQANQVRQIQKQVYRQGLQTDLGNALMTADTLSMAEFEAYYKSQASTAGTLKSNFVSGGLQALVCMSLLQTAIKKSGNDNSTELHKFAGSMAMLVGGILDYKSGVMGLKQELVTKKMGRTTNQMMIESLEAERTFAQERGRLLKNGARGLNIGGAAVFAFYDIKDGIDSMQRGEKTLAYLYYGSAGTAGLSTILLSTGVATGWIPVAGWILFGVSVVVGLTIMWYKKSPMQNWLRYGTWGTKSKGWSLEHELEELQKALQNKDIDLTDTSKSLTQAVSGFEYPTQERKVSIPPALQNKNLGLGNSPSDYKYEPLDISKYEIPNYEPLDMSEYEIPNYEPLDMSEYEIPNYEPSDISKYENVNYEPRVTLVTPENARSNGRSGGSGGSGSGTSPELIKQLQEARQRTANQATRVNERLEELEKVQKQIDQQNKQLAELEERRKQLQNQ